MKIPEDKKYIPTTKVKEVLKISDCSVMHLRISGELKFTKKGNSYLYLIEDVEKLVNIKIKKSNI